MKVLLVNYEYPTITANCGGGGAVTKTLYENLKQSKHTVQLYTDFADRSHYTFPARHHLSLASTTNKFDPDVVNAHFTLPTGLTAARVCQTTNTPLVTTAMGADLHDPTRYNLARPILNHLNHYVFNRSDKILTPSLDMGKRIPRRHQSNAKVTHYGIDPDNWTWSPRSRDQNLNVLTVCRLVDRKNLDLAIRTIENAGGRGLNLTHTIVGTGPKHDELEDQYGHLDWLTIKGYVDDLQSEYDKHDVFFLPSKHEAFGIVYLEALASGLPVIMSDTGGQTDIIKHDSRVGTAARPNVEALTHAFEKIWQEYDERQRATKNYIRDHFSARKMTKQYLQTYREVLA